MTSSQQMNLMPGHDPRSSFKERVKHEREQEILDAARDVFAEQGFEKASIDGIAERVGIGKGTVYLHFASKEDILTELMQRGSQLLLDKCRAKLSAQATATSKLEAVLSCLVDHRFANERWITVVIDELPHFLGKKHRQDVSGCLKDLVAQLIEEGQAQGELDPAIRPKVAATTLFLLVFLAPAIAGGGITTKQQLYQSSSQIFFHGITRR